MTHRNSIQEGKSQDAGPHKSRSCPDTSFLHSLGVAPCAISWQDEVVRYAGSAGQSMMFGWDETGRQPEASWNEFSGLYRAFLKKVTLSEVNREEKPVCYACVPSDTSLEKTILGFVPITFLSCFFIQTAKGM